MIGKYLLNVLLSFSGPATQDCKLVPLAHEGTFSPDGKHLAVCAEKVSVYDALSGAYKGDLPNLPSVYRLHPQSHRFSPKSTYFYSSYPGGKIWEVAQLQECFPGILASRKLELWNKEETVFLTSADQDYPQRVTNTWYVHDALDGKVIHYIKNHTRGVTESQRISADGKLISFIYKLTVHGKEKTVAAITNLNRRKTPDETLPIYIQDVSQVEFCPDNTHALMAVGANQIVIKNCKTDLPLHYFRCASQIEGYLAPPIGSGACTQNVCFIQPHGLMSIICNRLMPDERYQITQKQDEPTFTCNPLAKPDREQLVIPSLTKDQTIILKNKTTDQLGRAFYDAYLQKKDGVKLIETCLLKTIYEFFVKVEFAGNHNERIMIVDLNTHLLHIFDSCTGKELQKINFSFYALSMSKRSFVTQTKADGQKKFAWFLHILPTAAEILAKEKNSYFSLLPPDLTTTLKRFET